MPYTTGLMLIAILALSGCVFAPDAGDRGQAHAHAGRPGIATIGQELLDLERARQAGLITTAEFDSTKDRLLSGSSTRP